MTETAKSLIAEFWKETGVRKPKRGEVTEYASYSLFLADKLTSVAFQNHLELFDEFVSWLADVNVVLFSNLKRENVVYAQLASAICSLALSVRHLVGIGHDVSAKILARSLGEYSDVMALLILQPDGTPGGLSTQWCRSRCGAPARRRSRGLLRGREFGRSWPNRRSRNVAGGNWQKGGGCKRFSGWRQGTPGRARLLSEAPGDR